MAGNYIENFFRKLGKPLVRFIAGLGELSIFIAKSVYHSVTPPFYIKLLGKQMIDIGFYSLPVVALTTIFAGMVIALQTYSGFSSYGAESAVASVVLISFIWLQGRIPPLDWNRKGPPPGRTLRAVCMFQFGPSSLYYSILSL